MLGTFEHEWKKIVDEYNSLKSENGLIHDDLLKALINPESNLVIFGAGAIGSGFGHSLGDLSHKLVAFCDNYKIGFLDKFSIPIISPTQLIHNYPNSIIAICVNDVYGHNDEIFEQLISLGISKDKIFRRYSAYEQYDLEDFKKLHLEGYKWAYEFFNDEHSKHILLNRLKSYLFFIEMPHSPLREQYFEQNAIQFTDNEVFIDAGCYIGDTALEFVKRMEGKYLHIYGFEPDYGNYLKAINNLSEYKNINVTNSGLYNKTETLLFNSETAASSINELGSVEISVVSLDDFYSQESRLAPTFIKMDIEGSEKQALIGAKRIIQETLPKLAICVYHKPEDIYVLPKIINEYGDYEFTLRHYSSGAWETVLYANPKKIKG